MSFSPFLIERIILSNHRQFSHCDIDLCHPATGVPLKDCCFIGANGTGKSELLKNLYQAVSPSDTSIETDGKALVLIKVRSSDGSFYHLRFGGEEEYWYRDSIERESLWRDLPRLQLSAEGFAETFQEHRCSAEEMESEELSIFTGFFSFSEALINGAPADDYSGFLAGLVREREADFFSFLKDPANRSKTVEEAEVDFLSYSPNPLSSLKEIWDIVLGQAALVFDSDGEGGLVSSKTGQEVSFSHLSQGMQHFLLRIGQVFCRYFQKQELPGFLFLDEPETSLHPALQFNHINLFRSIISKHPTQMFVSTHSPLIASQFPAHSRILLEFDHDGTVQVSRGSAAEGSDPNQILMKDFGLKTVEPKRRVEQSGNYSKLKRAIRESEDEEDELANLIDQVMMIRRY